METEFVEKRDKWKALKGAIYIRLRKTGREREYFRLFEMMSLF